MAPAPGLLWESDAGGQSGMSRAIFFGDRLRTDGKRGTGDPVSRDHLIGQHIKCFFIEALGSPVDDLQVSRVGLSETDPLFRPSVRRRARR